MFETNNPKQPFYITNRVELYPTDLRVLIKLYQPLVGSLAVALYLSLNEDYSAQAMLSDSQGFTVCKNKLTVILKIICGSAQD
ncbi:hypothetical protein SDC49_16785 [Lactobacillus sp. R2/2]|nr:hypothetical protein [Lactobacillus sp. R2/2]